MLTLWSFVFIYFVSKIGCNFFFFFKQKTAYEMRISDWSSDVCSSDLNRLFVDAILWMAGNAAHWRDLPGEFGKWTAVHARFRRWSHNGVWEKLFHALADTPDFEYVLIDSTISKVHADATGAKGGQIGRAHV